MFSETFPRIKNHILKKLEQGLGERLTYHTIHHVKDVLKQAERIALSEGITDQEPLFLLKVSALYHDAGFLFVYTGHEEKSCDIAKEDLPRFGITPRQLDIILGLIRATRVPQDPANHLEEILCDADLDYLGRDDFYPISRTLYKELLSFHLLAGERQWNEIQVRFLETHHYFTQTSIGLRRNGKLMHLAAIRKMLQADDHGR
jgi:hypothetical protein